MLTALPGAVLAAPSFPDPGTVKWLLSFHPQLFVVVFLGSNGYLS